MQGKSFPTGQIWPKGSPAARGHGRYRMEFDQNNRHVLAIPGLTKAGNFLTMLKGPGGIQLSCNEGVTLEHFTTFCGGEVWGFEGDSVDRFYNLRALRRPGTNHLFAGGKFYQVSSRMWLADHAPSSMNMRAMSVKHEYVFHSVMYDSETPVRGSLGRPQGQNWGLQSASSLI